MSIALDFSPTEQWLDDYITRSQNHGRLVFSSHIGLLVKLDIRNEYLGCESGI